MGMQDGQRRGEEDVLELRSSIEALDRSLEYAAMERARLSELGEYLEADARAAQRWNEEAAEMLAGDMEGLSRLERSVGEYKANFRLGRALCDEALAEGSRAMRQMEDEREMKGRALTLLLNADGPDRESDEDALQQKRGR